MKKSALFWTGTLCLIMIPFLALDIPKNVVDWREQVSDQINNVAFDIYHLSYHQKLDLVSKIQHSDIVLTAEIWLRSLFSLLLFATAVALFLKSRKEHQGVFFSSFAIATILLAASVSLKIASWYSFSGNERIKLLTLSASDTTLENIYAHNFKGKVLYVDFWGTTCPPCVSEFLNFTKPLKQSYHTRGDIAYLYICGGHKFVWRQQLKAYDISGNHIFLNEDQYEKLYRKSVKNPKAVVLMPHYLIMDKSGEVVIPDAGRPSDGDTTKIQLNKYLAMR